VKLLNISSVEYPNMSGIFGIIHLNDLPVSEKEIETMHSVMAEWGTDVSNVWINDSAGLGSLVSFNTPEAVYEKLPLQSSQGFIMTVEARLDNREEILSLLDNTQLVSRSIPDGEVIMRAYEKWGKFAPDHLLGDWSFAAWHTREKKLFIARDHFGNTSIYYYHDHRRFIFASSKKALLSLGIPRRLNEFYLACLLISWPAYHGPQTIELDIQRLPPAHTLTLQATHLSTEQYWHLEDTPLLNLKNSQEYIEGFLSIYDQAVRDRMRTHYPLGVTLSGGLDSGSVTCLMAHTLKKKNKRFKAFTSVPLYDVTNTVNHEHRFGDELPFAQAVVSHAGNIDLMQIQAKTISPIRSIRHGLEIHVCPVHAAGNLYWIYDLLETAQKNGVGTLLTGQGGNATVSWDGHNKFRIMKKLLKQREWKSFLQLLIYPFIPLPLLHRFYGAFRKGNLNWDGTSINPDFAQRIDLASQYIHGMGTLSNPGLWQNPLVLRNSIIKPGASILGDMWAENGAAYNLEIRDPTLDKRVIEFTFSIPDREFTGPDGTDRWIIRTAMQKLMPDQVRLNFRRGRQASDIGQRLLASAPEVNAALEQVEASELAQKYLAIQHMRGVWEDLHKDVNHHNTNQTITILTRGLMAGLYLIDFEKAN
jgi:asparagine synthase (glutamine-hydrolysing)